MPRFWPEGKRKKFSLNPKPLFHCMKNPLFPMPLLRSSTILLLVILTGQGFAQVKNRDFTRRSGSEFKRYEGGSKLFGSMVNPRISGKVIHVSEIPFHYSRFGGKRFPVNQLNVLERRKLPVSTLNFPTVHGSTRVDASGKRALRDTAMLRSTTSVANEFRDKYNESLDKRVDQWMEKVNNLSLADVNRYQFRRDRSTTPGFPVQKAGETDPVTPSRQPLLPAFLQGGQSISAPKEKAPSRYWMGPKKITTTNGSSKSSSSTPKPRTTIQPTSRSVPGARVSPSRTTPYPRYPAVRLGPPKITVRTK